MANIKTRVLLVEDEEDAREVVSYYLGTLFDIVDVAKDGEEGFAKFNRNYRDGIVYDVIITDIKMPKKDGLSMLEMISDVNKEQKFVIVSAHKDEEYLFKSINLNVISYFVKPLVAEDLLETLKKELETSTKDHLITLNDTFSYDNQKKLLYSNTETIYLSRKETLLVDFLIDHRGEIMSNSSIKEAVWDDISTADATLRTLFKRVKDKLIENDFIISKKGRGYIIE